MQVQVPDSMRLKKAGRSASFALLCCLFAAGCATTDTKQMTPEQVQDTMAQANASAKSGEYDKALQLFDKVAKDNPTSKEPWLRTSQIQFDQGKYGPAIVAAQEVLQRDPADRTAKSILAVAGLRVSVKALGELRRENGLSGTTRAEAQTLTSSLRESLGEDTLVPQAGPAGSRSAGAASRPASASTPSAPAASNSRPPRRPSTPAASSASTPDASGTKVRSSGNPFGALQ